MLGASTLHVLVLGAFLSYDLQCPLPLIQGVMALQAGHFLLVFCATPSLVLQMNCHGHGPIILGGDFCVPRDKAPLLRFSRGKALFPPAVQNRLCSYLDLL